MRSLISSVALVCNNGVWTISGYGVPLNSPVCAKFVGEWAILQRIHMKYIEHGFPTSGTASTFIRFGSKSQSYGAHSCKGLKLLCTALVEAGAASGPSDRYYSKANMEVANEIEFMKNSNKPKNPIGSPTTIRSALAQFRGHLKSSTNREAFLKGWRSPLMRKILFSSFSMLLWMWTVENSDALTDSLEKEKPELMSLKSFLGRNSSWKKFNCGVTVSASVDSVDRGSLANFYHLDALSQPSRWPMEWGGRYYLPACPSTWCLYHLHWQLDMSNNVCMIILIYFDIIIHDIMWWYYILQ